MFRECIKMLNYKFKCNSFYFKKMHFQIIQQDSYSHTVDSCLTVYSSGGGFRGRGLRTIVSYPIFLERFEMRSRIVMKKYVMMEFFAFVRKSNLKMDTVKRRKRKNKENRVTDLAKMKSQSRHRPTETCRSARITGHMEPARQTIRQRNNVETKKTKNRLMPFELGGRRTVGGKLVRTVFRLQRAVSGVTGLPHLLCVCVCVKGPYSIIQYSNDIYIYRIFSGPFRFHARTAE